MTRRARVVRRLMPRRLRLGIVGCALLVLAAAPAVHAAGATLTEAGDARFPERGWILTLPSGADAPASSVGVLENGRPVTGLRVAPANEDGEGGGFGVVLAIDTSKSMTGAPIRDAMAAAREFARQRPPAQRLAVVTFNSSPTVLLKPTSDPEAIDAALAGTPALSPGTHLYDATAAALALLRRSSLGAGAVVVLSDGSDVGSTATPAGVGEAGRAARARVFTVGVGSSAAGARSLRDLAARTSGEHLGSAQGRGLVQVYRSLGVQLAGAYVVRYRSLAPAGRHVRVTALAEGQRATAAYRAPRITVAGASGPASKTGFLSTTPGIAIVSIAALLAAFLIISHLLLLRRDRGGIRERVGRYGPAEAAVTGPPEDLEQRGRTAAWRSGSRDSLAESLDIARMTISPEGYVLLWAAGALLLTVLAVALSGTLLMIPVALAGSYAAGRGFLSSRVERQRRAFADQLADGLQGVASAMRTGHSFAGALAVLVEEAPEPLAGEFGRVIADERLGIPLEEAFRQTIRRMDNRDLEQVALVAVLQRETGGNGAEALDRVVENLRARDEVRRLVKTLTAQGQLSRWVLTAIPIMLLLVLSVIGRGYTKPLFDTTTGNVLLVLSAVLVLIGSLTIKRIIHIKV